MGPAKKRIKYLDILKLIAIFSVIAIHSFYFCKAEVLHFRISSLKQIFLFAVPVFLMITGALSFNKDIQLNSFFKNRFVRIGGPLIFFSFLFFQFDFYRHFWYSWMILGVIFAIPIINKFIQYSNEREIEYFILVFIIFSILKQLFNIFSFKSAFDVSFFITPVSYLVLGYYLSSKKFNYSSNKILIISLILFVASTLIKIPTGQVNYTDQFTTHLDLTFVQIIQAASVFLFFRYICFDNVSGIFKPIQLFLNKKPMDKFILSVSKSSYGMYFVQHPFIFFIFKPYYKSLELTGTQSLIYCVSILLFTFFMSWIIILILSKIPYINKVVGYY